MLSDNHGWILEFMDRRQTLGKGPQNKLLNKMQNLSVKHDISDKGGEATTSFASLISISAHNRKHSVVLLNFHV